VRPEWRRRGIVKALVRECVREARERGATMVTLEALASNETALAVWRRLGFEEVEYFMGVPLETIDGRLADVRVGRWEGMYYRDLAQDPDYQRYLSDPLSERTPGGEQLGEIRDRAVASVHQALGDNPGGENVVIVTHAGIIRTLLVHYMGAALANFHRVRVSTGSISILRFASDRELPRVLAINGAPGGQLRMLLQ